jgi:hypothetical protein
MASLTRSAPLPVHRYCRPLLLALAVAASLGGPALLAAASGAPVKPGPAAGTGRSLFDGETLAGWKSSAFDSQAVVKVENPFRDGVGAIILEKSDYLSGITWMNGKDLPRMNYEISLEAMKLDGNDFFCGLTFQVGESAVTFVVGGWGGMVTGISCIDNSDASDNETSTAKEYKPNTWYRIRVRVTPAKLEAWIDDEQVVDFETAGRRLDLRFGDIKHSLPLGIAAFETRAALRNIELRRL